MKQANQHCSLQLFCRLFGYSRQAYHKQIRFEKKQTDEQSLILQHITFIRQEQPRCGTRKLLVMLQPFLKQNNLFIGRDSLFNLLAKNKMLVRKRNRCTFTTNSKHFFYRYPNLVKDFTPLHAHELWVADITYIPLKERFAYLYLITDAYSRKIVGFHVSEDMRVSSAVVALQNAIVQ
jgi:putative transposase